MCELQQRVGIDDSEMKTDRQMFSVVHITVDFVTQMSVLLVLGAYVVTLLRYIILIKRAAAESVLAVRNSLCPQYLVLIVNCAHWSDINLPIFFIRINLLVHEKFN